MSKSLSIVNGDLAIGGSRSYSIVSGRNKLVQDLTLWVLEHIGIDPSYPTYGNRLDGGIIDGQQIDGFIGQIMTNERVLEIRSEITGLLERYQAIQLERIKRDQIEFNGQQTIPPDEVLYVIESVEAKGVGDTVIVRVYIRTLSNNIVKLIVPVQT